MLFFSRDARQSGPDQGGADRGAGRAADPAGGAPVRRAQVDAVQPAEEPETGHQPRRRHAHPARPRKVPPARRGAGTGVHRTASRSAQAIGFSRASNRASPSITSIFSGIFPSFYRVLPIFTGFYWVLLGFTRFYQVLMNFTSGSGFHRVFNPNLGYLYRVLLGFTGFYLVLLGFTGFYLVLSRFIDFYWVLPSFIGFYWVLRGFYQVLPGFTAFYRVFQAMCCLFSRQVKLIPFFTTVNANRWWLTGPTR